VAVIFRDANWIAVRRAAEADGAAIVPLGSIEQHGPHLPCGTDAYQINEVVRRTLERCGSMLPLCRCPTIEYSLVQWASPLASAGLSSFTVERTLLDLVFSLTDLGFRKIAFLHGHYGLVSARSAAWEALCRGRHAMYVDVQPYEMAWEAIERLCGEPLNHGGTAETSMMLAIQPDLVDMSKARPGPASLWGEDFPYPHLVQKGVYAIPTVEDLADGNEGDPTRATAELGDQILDAMADRLAPLLSELASSPLPERYTRSYHRSVPKV
jgi:creatinine amidohydrolase